MRILILGGAGMLGHKLWQLAKERFSCWVTLRSAGAEGSCAELFDPARTIGGVDVYNTDTVVRAVAIARPQVIVNCIGIVKQLQAAKDPVASLTVNSLLPHRLAALSQAAGARLVHISTDCVFSGRKGTYTEDDISDAEDLYGRSKYLGEVSGPGALTLRTSIIGRELRTSSGLVEWFLSNRGGQVRGYRRAIYSGFTTLALARIILDIVQQQPDLSGLYQVSSEPISKYDLLTLVNAVYQTGTVIEPDSTFVCDRSLDSSRFRAATGFRPPGWPEMIRQMYEDATPYDRWRAL